MTVFGGEHNSVRAVDFLEWVTRAGWLKDVTSAESPIPEPGKPKTLLDVTVPEGQTWYAIESLSTVLGPRPVRLHLYGTPPGGKEAKRFVLVAPAESSDYRRVIRRTLPAGYRYRIEAEASPGLKPLTAQDTIAVRWTFITLPWVEKG